MKKISLGLALLFAVNAVSAESGPNWNFASLSYQSSDFAGETLDGFGISGSALVSENFFIMGAYGNVGTEVEGVDLDLNSTSFGLGYRYSASANTDIFGAVSYESMEVELSFEGESGSADGNGNGLQFGVRSMLSSNFEVVAAIEYLTIEDESETGFSLSGLYHVNEQFGIGVGYGEADDVETLSLSGVLFF